MCPCRQIQAHVCLWMTQGHEWLVAMLLWPRPYDTDAKEDAGLTSLTDRDCSPDVTACWLVSWVGHLLTLAHTHHVSVSAQRSRT